MKLVNIIDKLSAIMPRSAKKNIISLGLDIGSHSVKLVELEKTGQGYKLLNLAFCPVKNNNLPDAIKSVIGKTDVKNKTVILGLSGQQIVIRPIFMPDMAETDFKNSLKYEAAKHIPFAIEEVVLDAVILRHKAEKGRMLVLLAAAKKDFIRRRIELVSGLGIEPAVIDIDSLAITNIFKLAMETGQKNGAVDAASALLNIGSRISNLVLLEKGFIRFSRDIVFGGNDLTVKIAAKLGIDISSAEEKKLSEQQSPDIRDVLVSTMANLISELRLSFDYYESQTGRAVEKVYLSGGGSCLVGLDEMMSQAMNIPFVAWNPFSKLEMDEAAEKKAGEESGFGRFAVAAGLAIR